jgi:hypothetical protein
MRATLRRRLQAKAFECGRARHLKNAFNTLRLDT